MKTIVIVIAALVALLVLWRLVTWLIWFTSCHSRRRPLAEIFGAITMLFVISTIETAESDLAVYSLAVGTFIAATGLAWLTDYFPTERRLRF